MNKYRTHNCSELSDKDIGKIVHLSGWLHRKRDHGNLLFIDLRDHYGITQFVIENKNKYFPILEKSKSESVLKITGKQKLLSADPALQLSVNLRNRTIIPLGFLQVALLGRLREQNRQPPISETFLNEGHTERTYSRSEMLRGALLTINGIAAGMRNTG